jgi:glutamine synthetase
MNPTPQSINPPTSDFRWIRLAFVDVLGTSCALAIPAARFDEATSTGVLFDGSALEGPARYLEVDMRLRADESTLFDLGVGEARVTCTVLTPDGAPWLGDPRTALQIAIEQAGDLAESYTASAELEFYLLGRDGEPVDQASYFDDSRGLGWNVTRESAAELERQGMAIASCHHEDGPGQYEIGVAASGPLALADTLVIAKETIRRVAATADLQATFMARPLSDRPGSGLHLHQRSPELIALTGELTDAGRGFLAGQLAHASGLTALASPTVNSYRRLHAGPEAPSTAIWSNANRSALIRVNRAAGADGSIEFRGADPMANPYLLLAALVTTGLAGIDDNLELVAPNDEGTGFDPSSARRYESLPRNLDEALDALAKDDVLVDLFDPTLLTNLIDGRRSELESFRSHVTSWERDRYLDKA